MAHGVNATVEAVQVSDLRAVANPVVAQPGVCELATRDDAMLGSGEPRNRPIDGGEPANRPIDGCALGFRGQSRVS